MAKPLSSGGKAAHIDLKGCSFKQAFRAVVASHCEELAESKHYVAPASYPPPLKPAMLKCLSALRLILQSWPQLR